MDIVERLRDEPELTPAQYWEAQADMWHQNYKEATNEIERLQKELKFTDEVRQSALQSLFAAEKEIKRLRKENQRQKEHIMLLYSMIQTEHNIIRVAALKEKE